MRFVGGSRPLWLLVDYSCVWCSAQTLGKGPAGRKLGSSRPGLRECGGYCLSPLMKPWKPGQGPAGLEEWLWLLEPVLVTTVLLWRSWATLLRREVEIRTFSSALADLIETSPGGLWAASPAGVWKAGVV